MVSSGLKFRMSPLLRLTAKGFGQMISRYVPGVSSLLFPRMNFDSMSIACLMDVSATRMCALFSRPMLLPETLLCCSSD